MSAEQIATDIVQRMEKAAEQLLALAPSHEDRNACIGVAQALYKAAKTANKYFSSY
jgi:hypothetical protein